MSEHDFGPERPDYLLPCPFCGGGEYRGSATHLPPRMDGPGALVSFTIRHWCFGSVSGAVRSSREVRAAEPDWAIQEWNRRAGSEEPETIDKMKKENGELREALRPFAQAADDCNFGPDTMTICDGMGLDLTIGHCRQARTLLSQSSEGGET